MTYLTKRFQYLTKKTRFLGRSNGSKDQVLEATKKLRKKDASTAGNSVTS